MKKITSLTAVIMFLLLVTSFSANAVEPKDVSEAHWAYQSVTKLIDRGYLSLYEDGTFKGNNKVSRYELAVIIARMLGDIQDSGEKVSEEDAGTLRKLSLEFRDELVEIAKKQEDILQRVKNTEEKNVIQNNAIGGNREKIDSIDQEISNIVDNILRLKNLSKEVEKLNEEVKNQSVTIDNLQEKLGNNQNTISQINNKMKNISSEVGSQDAINKLKDQQSVTVTNIHSLKNQVNSLDSKVENQNKTIDGLKKQNDQYKMYLIGLAVLSLASF